MVLAGHTARSIVAYLVNLVEHSDIVTELERRPKHDDKRREYQVYVQTLQPPSTPTPSLQVRRPNKRHLWTGKEILGTMNKF